MFHRLLGWLVHGDDVTRKSCEKIVGDMTISAIDKSRTFGLSDSELAAKFLDAEEQQRQRANRHTLGKKVKGHSNLGEACEDFNSAILDRLGVNSCGNDSVHQFIPLWVRWDNSRKGADESTVIVEYEIAFVEIGYRFTLTAEFNLTDGKLELLTYVYCYSERYLS